MLSALQHIAMQQTIRRMATDRTFLRIRLIAGCRRPITDAMNTDSVYHRLFSHPVMVEGLVREFVPDAMAAGVDFASMEKVPTKFHGPLGERREGDVIWRLPTAYGSDVYLYLLIEFQSQSDWWMPLRTQVYQGLLWQQIVAEQSLKAGDKLPPVILIVLYNGGPRWTAPTDLASLIALPAGSPLWDWQPRAHYHLIDMGGFPSGDLERLESLTALLVRLERRQEPARLAQLVEEVIRWFRRHPDYGDLRRLFTALVEQAIKGVGIEKVIPADLTEMRTMLATLGEYWKEQWKAEGLEEGRAEGLRLGLQEGREEGREEGRQEGRQEGRTEARHEERVGFVLRLMERRFGNVPDDVKDRVAAADLDTLDLWTDRAIDAESMEAVFKP